MRRKDREKDEKFALTVLSGCEYATLATVNPDGTPYCIPVSPVLIDKALYFHCAAEGQKITNIIANEHVCVSCVSDTKLRPELLTTQYKSAVVFGVCSIVNSEEEKTKALYAICQKYAKDNTASADIIASSLSYTCVCRINIDKVFGKANVPAQQ